MAFSRKMEEKTVRTMVKIYCKDTHRPEPGTLCEQCSQLLGYALKRIEICPHGDQKPVCAKCTVHCYKAEMRQEIKGVMRYAGPRMLYKQPLLTLRYMYRKFLKS